MAVNNPFKMFYNISQVGKYKNPSNLLQYFNCRISRGKNYHGNLPQYCFIILAPGDLTINLLGTKLLWYPTLSNWEFVESIILASIDGQDDINKDPTVWVDGAGTPYIGLIGPALPEYEFGKVMI
jgi:hypothetical protein